MVVGRLKYVRVEARANMQWQVQHGKCSKEDGDDLPGSGQGTRQHE
jgi:hypothetical protein